MSARLVLHCLYGNLNRGHIRVFGLAGHLLLLAFRAAAVNLQIIDAHREIHLRT